VVPTYVDQQERVFCTVYSFSALFQLWGMKFRRLKGRVHCFSMQDVINKRFIQNPKKKFAEYSSCRFREKQNLNFKK